MAPWESLASPKEVEHEQTLASAVSCVHVRVCVCVCVCVIRSSVRTEQPSTMGKSTD